VQSVHKPWFAQSLHDQVSAEAPSIHHKMTCESMP